MLERTPPLMRKPLVHVLHAMLLGGSGMAMAQDAPTTTSAPTSTLSDVQVKADALAGRELTRADIDATPSGNRDLTSLIADNPAVRLDSSMGNNGNHGSLAPGAFAIHGESPYQNQFLIDGVSGSNAINPHESQTGLQVGRVPGFSQAYNIDTELLDSVKVHDSMVPVEFGRFQGGVVNAKIRTPKGDNRFSIKHSFNSSNLTRQRMPEGVMQDWLHGEPGYSAIWKKHFTTVQGDLRVSERTTALLGFSRRNSAIARQGLVLDSGGAQPNGNATQLETRDENDRVNNLLAKLHTRWSAHTQSSLTFKYADRQERLVSNSFANTAWTNQQEAMGVALEVQQSLRGGQLSATLGIDELDSARLSNADDFVVQQFEDAMYSRYTQGGFGTESLKQRQLTGKLRMDGDRVQTGAVSHQVYAGLDVQHTKARFVRDSDVNSQNQTLLADGTQRVNTRVRYAAGEVPVSTTSLALYVADTMAWRNLSFTAGTRLSHDTLLNNTYLSPRLRLDWDVQGNSETRVSVGRSRYHGMDVLGYAMESGRSRLQQTLVQNGRPVQLDGGTAHRHDDLKTPYSDEWAFQLKHGLNEQLEAGLSFVTRRSRDGITRVGTSAKGYDYANELRGKARTLALSLRTRKPWQALDGRWTAHADFSWHKAHRNHDPLSGWDAESEAPDDLIEVNGEVMRRSKKPASGFDQPRRLSLGVTGRWAQHGVTWGNRINWDSNKTGIAYLGTRQGMQRYGTQRLGSNWTWDTNFTYEPAALKGLSLQVNVLNVLNRREPLAIANPVVASNVRYQTGREIWLSVGYQY